MIFILCEPGTETAGDSVAGALKSSYPSMPLEILGAQAQWNRPPEWNDLLIVVYSSRVLSAALQKFIQNFQSDHPVNQPQGQQSQNSGSIVPVCDSKVLASPPKPISALKAAHYNGSDESLQKISTAVGVFLGIMLRPESQSIFISYRQMDGKKVAERVFHLLKQAGFHPWLDEANDNIPIGSEVQDQIRSNLQKAAMVILIDTPRMPESEWIKWEIDFANSQLIPILPVVLGKGEKGPSRSIALQGLNHWVNAMVSGMQDRNLNSHEWREVLKEIESMLLQAYRQRMKLQAKAKEIFEEYKFSWDVLSLEKRMFKSKRTNPQSIETTVLTHCLVHDVEYMPAIDAYIKFIEDLPPRRIVEINHKICLYDRDTILSIPEMDTIRERFNQFFPLCLVHYNELEVLINSNFARLR